MYSDGRQNLLRRVIDSHRFRTYLKFYRDENQIFRLIYVFQIGFFFQRSVNFRINSRACAKTGNIDRFMQK